MNKLITKARSGVTLVELLVVILIVTILSVSMLPLLQPFVVEAQYAAEPIPVIGNLRTKIGVYQYDKGKLPCIGTRADETDPQNVIQNPVIETWIATEAQDGTAPAADPSAVDYFNMATAIVPATPAAYSPQGFNTTGNLTANDNPDDPKNHFGILCDIDYQELKGKRSKPNHYQYLVLKNNTDYVYFLGCFGDGNGLKTGTGYAVCEIVSPSTGHKYVGTWKRYKAVGDATAQISFSTNGTSVDTDPKHTAGCYVPAASAFSVATGSAAAAGKDATILATIGAMEQRGWEF